MQINKAYRRGFGLPVENVNDYHNSGPGLHDELGTEGARTYFGGGGRGARSNVTEFPRSAPPSQVNSKNIYTSPRAPGEFRGEAKILETPQLQQGHKALNAIGKMEKAGNYPGAVKMPRSLEQQPWVQSNKGLRKAIQDGQTRLMVKIEAGKLKAAGQAGKQ